MILGFSINFLDFRWLDAIDILLVAFLFYQLYNLVRGTVAIRIFAGILAIYVLWKIVEALQMEMLSEILGQFIGVGVIALIIVFQQEIRRFLLLLGTRGIFSRNKGLSKLFNIRHKQNKIPLDIQALIKSIFNLSKNKTGSLIILARETELKYYASTGVMIEAKVSSALIENIFEKNTPLHDGGMLIVNNKIIAARCILPVSEGYGIPGNLGLRHRAGVGITESSDALAIVVSEETGNVSYCKDGKLKLGISVDELRQLIESEFEEV